MTEIKTTAGDKLYNLAFTLRDNDNNPVDITGATIYIKAQHETGTTLAFTGTATITSGALGTCTYQVQDGDIDEPGRYYAEVEVQFLEGGISTFTDIVINASRQLPRTI